MKNPIILVGAFHEIIELAEKNHYTIIGLIDNQKNGYYYNYKILCDDDITLALNLELKAIPVVITPDSPQTRKKLFELYSDKEYKFVSLIDKRANISKSTLVGLGTVIQVGVNISCEARIGIFAKINTFANVMHNSIIGDFTTIAPNAVILGNVRIGTSCYLGANTTILPNIEIGDETIIGAGAVVTKSISNAGVYDGNQ